MKKIRKTKKVPNGYQIVTFDTISLFTDVPLDRTIWLLFKNKFEKHEVYANVAKQEIGYMLMLWTKNFHFTFNEGTYKQTVGLAMSAVGIINYIITIINNFNPNIKFTYEIKKRL